MKLKGGDSNKRFQNTFFKHQVKCKGIDKEFQNAEQNRSKFWGSHKNVPPVIDSANEVIALNLIALLTSPR